MSIPPQLSALINQVNQELNQLEEEATQALALIRPYMSALPGNPSLVQAFSTLNNAQFLVLVRRSQIERLVDRISPECIPEDIIQDTGEDLSTFLGEIFELREIINNIKRRLEDL